MGPHMYIYLSWRWIGRLRREKMATSRGGRLGAALLGILLLVLPPLGHARDLRDKEAATPATDRADVQGASIIVTTNSEGVTEVTVSQTNISWTDFLQMLNNMSVPLTYIPGISKPGAHRSRTLHPLPLTRAAPFYPTYFLPPVSSVDLADDPFVLVAPVEGGGEEQFEAYVLPKGLSSLPPQMSKALFSSKEGFRKAGLLLFPSDVAYMGLMGRAPPGSPFPLDAIHIKDIRVVDGEARDVSLEAVLSAFGYGQPGNYGAPWLLIRDVVDEGAEATEQTASRATRAPPPARLGNRRGGPVLGAIYVGKDGGVTWEALPGAPPPPLLGATPPFPPLPWFPRLPPLPFFPSSFLNPFWSFPPPPPFLYPSFLPL